MSNKKEIQIGETVQMGLVTLVCEESFNCCEGCYFGTQQAQDEGLYCPIQCVAQLRTDKKDVIFKLKEE